MNLSVVILTKNEASNITECLKALQWADELIVIDDHSDDDTVALAKKQGALVYFHAVQGDFAQQRNFGLEKAHGEWVLFVDADERISQHLKQEILEVTTARRNRFVGYSIRRSDFLFGRELKHGETAAVRFLRLAKKGSGVWQGRVHEVWDVRGHTGELFEPINHYPHATVAEFLSDINFYTDLRAHELYKQHVRSSWYMILLYTKGKFLKNYFISLGFLDGIPGLISAIMMSFHSFLVRSKLWLLWQKK